MKPKTIIYQTLDEAGLQNTTEVNSDWALGHVIAACRKNNFDFVTKARALSLGDPNSATWYKAALNMRASTHLADIEQIDIDLVNSVGKYWASAEKKPDYLQTALQIKDSINVDKQLPTLALLFYEYLKRAETAYNEWNLSKPIVTSVSVVETTYIKKEYTIKPAHEDDIPW